MPLVHLLISAALACHVLCLLFKKSEILCEVRHILWRTFYLFINEQSGEKRPIDVKVQNLMLEFKVKQFHVVMAVGSFGISAVLLPAALLFTSHPRLNSLWIVLLMFYIAALVLTFTSLRLSSRCIDMLCGLGMFCLVSRVCLMSGDWKFFLLAGARTSTRALLSLSFFDIRKTVLWNVFLSTAIWRQYAANITVIHEGGLPQDHAAWFLTIELCIFLAVVILVVGVRFSIESRFRATLDAESAHHGMHKLLIALCDVVLRLDPELHMTDSTPQLLHLLGRQQQVSRDGDTCSLDGSSFISHLASESDQRRFQAFISASRSHVTAAQCEGGPPALLPVHMRNAQGCQIPVEVFHAHLPDFEQNPSHLLGIRVVGELPTLEASETVERTCFQHLLEHGSTAPAAHSGLSAALPRRPSSRSSTSWESVLTCQHTPLPQIADVTLVIDAFDPRLRMSSYTMNFAVGEENIPTYGLLDWLVSEDEAQQFVTKLQTFLNSALGCSSGCCNMGPLLLQLPTLSLDGSIDVLSESVSISLQHPAADVEPKSDGEDSLYEEHDMFNSEFNTSLPVVLKLESVSRLRKIWTRRLKKRRMAPVIEGRRSSAEGSRLRRLRHPN